MTAANDTETERYDELIKKIHRIISILCIDNYTPYIGLDNTQLSFPPVIQRRNHPLRRVDAIYIARRMFSVIVDTVHRYVWASNSRS